MSWHVEVDPDSCAASGVCAGIAPHLFRLEGDTAEVVAADVEPDEAALDAADLCQTMAITVVEAENGGRIGPRP
ncbi:ferredoxin [Streptomyces sp. NPDC054796]